MNRGIGNERRALWMRGVLGGVLLACLAGVVAFGLHAASSTGQRHRGAASSAPALGSAHARRGASSAASAAAPAKRPAAPHRPPTVTHKPPTVTRKPPTVTVVASVYRAPGALLSLSAPSFASPTDGWAVDRGAIVHTADGGRDWARQYHGRYRVEGVAAVSRRRAWAVGNDCHGPAHPADCTAALLRTVNGGATWTVVITRPGKTFFGVAASGRRSLWVGLYAGLTPIGSLSVRWLHSSDGGRVWHPVTGFCHKPDIVFVSLSFISPSRGWALCAGEPGAGSQSKALLETRDGGRSWKTVVSVRIGVSSPVPGGFPGGTYASRLFFLDPAHGWLATSFDGIGVLMFTDDGGRTWRPVVGKQRLPAIRMLDFPSASHGYLVVGRGVGAFLLKSDDGGHVWRQVAPRLGPVGVYGSPVTAVPGGPVVAAGTLLDATAVLTSADGGRTWRVAGGLPPSTAAQLTDLSFPTAADGWAAAQKLWRTTDGGRRWRAVAHQVNGPWLVSFPSTRLGFVLTLRGVLYRTTDGGASFRRVTSGLHDVALQFVNAHVGFAGVAGRDVLAYTVDGGRTWRYRSLPVKAPVVGVSFWDPQHGVVAVSHSSMDGLRHSALLTTADGGRTWSKVIMLDAAGLQPDNVAFSTATTGILAAVRDQTYRTSDGGQSWTRVP